VSSPLEAFEAIRQNGHLGWFCVLEEGRPPRENWPRGGLACNSAPTTRPFSEFWLRVRKGMTVGKFEARMTEDVGLGMSTVETVKELGMVGAN
jgi:hypothetical protein